MAQRIRRYSMERLELYDLDNMKIQPSVNKQLAPPLPPPRKHKPHLTTKSAFERYEFLCNSYRQKTDSIYATTPMFTIIPQPKHIKHRRQLLGSYVPSRIIKPLSTTSPTPPEPATSGRNDNDKDKEKNNDDDDDDADENADDDDRDRDAGDDSDNWHSSSSSDDNNNNNDNDILDDDDNKKGIVEQIFNRDKK